MRWVALALLTACSMSKSAEREDSFAQQGETRREEGPWTRETWEWTPEADGTSEAKSTTTPPPVVLKYNKPPERVGRDSYGSGGIMRHTVETHAPVVSTSTTTVEASGEAKEARSARFGFSPWQWAIGGLVALAGLYGLFRLKGRLGL